MDFGLEKLLYKRVHNTDSDACNSDVLSLVNAQTGHCLLVAFN